LIILIFSSFRITHLLVYDNITWFLRKPFLSIHIIHREDGRPTQQIEVKGKGIRRFIGSLFICHWCMGIWVAGFVVTIYHFLPSSFYFLLIFAVAGIAAIVESKLTKK